MTPEDMQALVLNKDALILPHDAKILCAVLALPHIFYYILWTDPKAWRAAVKKNKWGDACHAAGRLVQRDHAGSHPPGG